MRCFSFDRDCLSCSHRHSDNFHTSYGRQAAGRHGPLGHPGSHRAPQQHARMLVKFETKSNRVKGLAFHPKRCVLRACALCLPLQSSAVRSRLTTALCRPWILASLHSGVIQVRVQSPRICVHSRADTCLVARSCGHAQLQPVDSSGLFCSSAVPRQRPSPTLASQCCS